jgi:hypothetical protein
MKLYTEEQVMKILFTTKQWGNLSNDYLIATVIPIELPSNEEISIEASNRHYGTNFKHVFASGAKWMKEQILNQNK